jgi:hypothetical protein
MSRPISLLAFWKRPLRGGYPGPTFSVMPQPVFQARPVSRSKAGIASLEGADGCDAAAQRIAPATLAEIVSLLLRRPNNASVAGLVVNTRLESTL